VQGVELVGVEEMDFFDSVLFDPSDKNCGVVGLIGGVAEVVIKDVEFTFFKISGVVAHRRVEEGEFLLVVAKVGSARSRFDHTNEKIWGGGGEEGVGGEKLVSKDPD
jgi:hypothetical protein